ncbi:MAG: hypothetical protein FWG30_05945 [Eubacteriaceae bacterium]|nr:hypothetical protein [Eubacteriaceae bacterium]
MERFLERVENCLYSKSGQELREIIIKLASRVPSESQDDFLSVIENENLAVNNNPESNIDTNSLLDRIRTLFDEIEDYDIEAYYDDGGWYGPDSYDIEDDSGFADEVAFCYTAAELLLSQGLFNEADEAFSLLLKSIEKFDSHNEYNDCGGITFDTLIDEGWLHFNLKKAKALRGYAALMADKPTLKDDLEEIFLLCNSYTNEIMFNDLLTAGSVPIPDINRALELWLDVLYRQNPIKASAYIKEAALLLNSPDVFEYFVRNIGSDEPLAYIDYCSLLTEFGEATEKIMQTAIEGLSNTETGADKRGVLASMLADMATQIGDKDIYKQAVLERLYSYRDLASYMHVYDLGSTEANQDAISFLDTYYNDARSSNSFSSRYSEYCIIKLLNKQFDSVFALVKEGHAVSVWEMSLESSLFPFFLGFIAGFADQALTIKALIKDQTPYTDSYKLYNCFKKIIGTVSDEQVKEWYEWCISCVRNRVDTIVSGQQRGSYCTAAQLLVAVSEIHRFNSKAFEREDPDELLHEYLGKYPRHSAFKKEVQLALGQAKL